MDGARNRDALGAASGRSARRATLAGAFDPKRNGFGALRVGLALAVAVTHAIVIGFGWQPRIGGSNLSDLAVDGFFVISGFLVTGSLLRVSLRRFVWHRFLRIMPGFWVCLVVTAVLVAPLAAVVEGAAPLSVVTAEQDPAWRYVLANSSLVMLQYGIAGLGEGTGSNGAFDGALWTLKYEALCYALLAVLGTAVALRRRRWPLLVACAVVWVAGVVAAAGGPALDLPALEPDATYRFLLLFLLGAVASRYGDAVPVSPLAATVAAASVAGALAAPGQYHVLGGPGLAYLCLWAAVRLPLPEPRWDVSYGVYIYHWPIQVVLAAGGLQALGAPAFVVLSVVLALGAGALSWTLVERRALAQKDARWVERLPRRAVPPSEASRTAAPGPVAGARSPSEAPRRAA